MTVLPRKTARRFSDDSRDEAPETFPDLLGLGYERADVRHLRPVAPPGRSDMTWTWRERILAARARGVFSKEDRRFWLDTITCPAAEVGRAYGVHAFMVPGVTIANLNGLENLKPWQQLWRRGSALGDMMDRRDFQAALDLLDELEDLAVELKRGAPACV